MAVLRSDLSIDTTPDITPDTTADAATLLAAPPAVDLTGRGLVTASYHQLHARLGRPDRFVTPHRNMAIGSGMWVLDTPAGRSILRLANEVPETTDGGHIERRWLILAAGDDVLPWVYKAVHGSTAAFPTGALSHFTEATLQGFGHAYLAYLYLRMNAETTRRDQLDRTAPDFRTHLHRPRQINQMLITLADALLHYEWAHATAAERAAWSAMHRPTPSDGLRYWKARNRWLYEPIKTEHYPHGGNPDLPGMLRTLADTARTHRDLLRERVPEMDIALHDEHEQTLRALADTVIPGFDILQLPRAACS